MRKFYELATIDDSNAVLLDGKSLTSPAKNKVIAPTPALAEAIAEEWNAQGEKIDKNTLPLTGMASLALDIAHPRRNELIIELIEYGETDLMFYHSDDTNLNTQQRIQWQPWLNRAQVEFGTRYETTESIMPIAQPEENKSKHIQRLDQLDQWQLALLAAVVKPTTSLLLGWYFLQNELESEELFTLSRLEEQFNIDKWGEDDEAKEKAESIRNDIAAAQHWKSLL